MPDDIVKIVLDDNTEMDLENKGKIYAIVVNGKVQPGYIVFASNTWLERFGIREPMGAISRYVHEMQFEPRVGFHVYQVMSKNLLGLKPRSEYKESDRVSSYTGKRVKEVIRTD